MAITLSTGFVSAGNGKTLAIDIPGTHVESARVRWRGRSKYDSWGGSNTGAMSAAFPSPPSGFDVTGGSAQFAVTINAGWTTAEGDVSVSAPGGNGTTHYQVAGDTSLRVTAGTACYGYGIAEGSWSISGSGSASNPVTSVFNSAQKTTPTANPRIYANGQQASGPASLSQGTVSDWYALPAGMLVGGLNTLSHSIDGSLQADIEIEYTYQPNPPAPEQQVPLNLEVTADRTPAFEFVLSGHEDSDSEAYHGRLTISRSPTLSNPVIADSSVSQAGWTYLDGESWEPIPEGGVPSGTTVRYIPPADLDFAVWHWAAATKDDWGPGVLTSVWALRVVLSVNALEGYQLAIDSVLYQCADLAIDLSCNGKLSTIYFVVSNLPDENGIRNYDRIAYGDSVNVSIYDSTGYEEQYNGVVWEKNPGPTTMKIVAGMGDQVLAGRILKTDYLNQDLGASLAAAVDNHCAPVLSTGIPNPMGVTATLPLRGRYVLDLFEQARKAWGLRWWVDTDLTDWVTHVVDPVAVAEEGVIVRYGEEVEGDAG